MILHELEKVLEVVMDISEEFGVVMSIVEDITPCCMDAKEDIRKGKVNTFLNLAKEGVPL